MITSPGGMLEGRIFANSEGRLTYAVRRGELEIIAAGPIGLIVDGHDLGDGVPSIRACTRR